MRGNSSGGVEALFRAINPRKASGFSFTRPSTIHLPSGAYDGHRYHQQGIQKTEEGHFAVSGSAHDTGYIYLAERNREIRTVIRPGYGDSAGPYNHAGGIQVVDGILVAGLERTGDRNGWSVVVFFDIQDIRNPRPLEHLTVVRQQDGSTAGAVSLARYGSVWLLLVANWDSERLDFYECSHQDLRDDAASFVGPTSQWSEGEDGVAAGSVDSAWGSYQNINMFTQAGAAGPELWFIGMYSSGLLYRDIADLYRLEYRKPRSVVVKRAKAHFRRSGGGPRFDWAAGVHYDVAAKRFEVYSCEQHADRHGDRCRCNVWR